MPACSRRSSRRWSTTGAAVDGPEGDGTPLMTALAFGYPEAANTLVRRGARVDNVPAAAALGRVDLVADVAADRPQREEAFVWACRYGRATVVELLLEQGVDPAAADKDAMTGPTGRRREGTSRPRDC
jgi:ankyrin repeat protein